VLRGLLCKIVQRTTQEQSSGGKAAPQNVAHHDFFPSLSQVNRR